MSMKTGNHFFNENHDSYDYHVPTPLTAGINTNMNEIQEIQTTNEQENENETQTQIQNQSPTEEDDTLNPDEFSIVIHYVTLHSLYTYEGSSSNVATENSHEYELKVNLQNSGLDVVRSFVLSSLPPQQHDVSETVIDLNTETEGGEEGEEGGTSKNKQQKLIFDSDLFVYNRIIDGNCDGDGDDKSSYIDSIELILHVPTQTDVNHKRVIINRKESEYRSDVSASFTSKISNGNDVDNANANGVSESVDGIGVSSGNNEVKVIYPLLNNNYNEVGCVCLSLNWGLSFRRDADFSANNNNENDENGNHNGNDNGNIDGNSNIAKIYERMNEYKDWLGQQHSEYEHEHEHMHEHEGDENERQNQSINSNSNSNVNCANETMYFSPNHLTSNHNDNNDNGNDNESNEASTSTLESRANSKYPKPISFAIDTTITKTFHKPVNDNDDFKESSSSAVNIVRSSRNVRENNFIMKRQDDWTKLRNDSVNRQLDLRSRRTITKTQTTMKMKTKTNASTGATRLKSKSKATINSRHSTTTTTTTTTTTLPTQLKHHQIPTLSTAIAKTALSSSSSSNNNSTATTIRSRKTALNLIGGVDAVIASDVNSDNYKCGVGVGGSSLRKGINVSNRRSNDGVTLPTVPTREVGDKYWIERIRYRDRSRAGTATVNGKAEEVKENGNEKEVGKKYVVPRIVVRNGNASNFDKNDDNVNVKRGSYYSSNANANANVNEEEDEEDKDVFLTQVLYNELNGGSGGVDFIDNEDVLLKSNTECQDDEYQGYEVYDVGVDRVLDNDGSDEEIEALRAAYSEMNPGSVTVAVGFEDDDDAGGDIDDIDDIGDGGDVKVSDVLIDDDLFPLSATDYIDVAEDFGSDDNSIDSIGSNNNVYKDGDYGVDDDDDNENMLPSGVRFDSVTSPKQPYGRDFVPEEFDDTNSD